MLISTPFFDFIVLFIMLNAVSNIKSGNEICLLHNSLASFLNSQNGESRHIDEIFL